MTNALEKGGAGLSRELGLKVQEDLKAVDSLEFVSVEVKHLLIASITIFIFALESGLRPAFIPTHFHGTFEKLPPLIAKFVPPLSTRKLYLRQALLACCKPRFVTLPTHFLFESHASIVSPIFLLKDDTLMFCRRETPVLLHKDIPSLPTLECCFRLTLLSTPLPPVFQAM